MKRSLISTLAGGLFLASMTACNAVTFAQFVEAQPTTGTFENVANGTSPDVLQSSNPAGTAGSIPVVFYFQGGTTKSGTPINVPIDGILTLTSTASDSAIQTGANVQQDFNGVSFTITAANTANNTSHGIAAGSLLLGATSGMGTTVGGTLSGALGGNSATFSGSDLPSGSALGANTVTFSSNYLDFTSAMNKAFAYSFSNVVPILGLGGNFPFQYINAFTSEGTGTFSSDFAPPPVPEPGSVALFVGLGVSGAMFQFRRRRRA